MRLQQLQKLGKQEIAGAKTINPIVDFLRAIQTRTPDYLRINENALGGMFLDLDIDAIIALVKQGGGMVSDFAAEVDGDGYLTCTAGKVYLPSTSVAISPLASTAAVNGNMLYVQLTSLSAGSLVYGSPVTRTYQYSPDKLTLPVCTTVQQSGAWGIRYHHIGDYILTNTPYFWISNYDSGAAQSLDHSSGGGLVWTTYRECE